MKYKNLIRLLGCCWLGLLTAFGDANVTVIELESVLIEGRLLPKYTVNEKCILVYAKTNCAL
jgi:hypothetical protein